MSTGSRHGRTGSTREGSDHGVRTEQIRRWESGALAHAVTDPFGQGPVPWLRGSETYFDDTGQVVPWYVDTGPRRRARGHRPGIPLPPAPHPAAAPAPPTTCAARSRASPPPARSPPARPIDFHVTVDPPQEFSRRHLPHRPLRRRRRGEDHHQPPPLRHRPAARRSPPTARSPATTGGSPGGCRSPPTGASARTSPSSPPPTATAPTSPSRSATTARPTCCCSCPTSPGRRTTSTRRTAAPAPASTTPGTSRAGCSARPTPRPRSPSTVRTRARASPCTSATPTTSSAGPSATATTSPTPTPATCTPAGVDPTRYRGLVFPGHDEYWSAPMRRTVELARDSGTSLVFLSANTMYWQVELGPSPSGVPDRLLTCRKRRGPGQPGALARDRPPRAAAARHPVRGPGPRAAPPDRPQRRPLAVGGDRRRTRATSSPGLVAGEADRYFPRTPLPEHQRPHPARPLPVPGQRGRHPPPGDLPLPGPLRRPGLRVRHLRLVPGLDRPGHVDTRVQRATANLLDRICKRD